MQYLGQGDLYSRAMAAYFRSGAKAGVHLPQPARMDSGEYVSPDGRYYVRLANVNGILAVYRVKPDGFLRRLKRWPKALEEDL
jgi:hypothetical protein